MASLLRAYNTSLARRPMITQMATAGFLFGAGDVLAQQAIERKGSNHDASGIFAPIVSRWYMLLERVPVKGRRATILTKVGLDQFVLTPGLVALFFTSMSLMEGKGFKEIQRRLDTAWFPTLVKNWGVFIPTQLANFSVVPLQHRLLVVNVVSLFWNSYLSYANSLSQKAVEEIESS